MSDLLALPQGLDGLPHETRDLAFGWANSVLPTTQILSVLGQAVLDQALINAAAHWIVTTRQPDTSGATLDPRPDGRPQTYKPDLYGSFQGSAYGDAVAQILAKLPHTRSLTRWTPFPV